ncbi:ABC transporter ATP-binding protein [Cycloclasticus pugetii]|uniref:ABC transporter ATP-binding protein n=1 Tax=Cycloclasticus pugetii TaxID=34068 RepID=UPI003A8E8CF9
MGTVVVKNVGKAYKQYPTKFARLLEWIMPFLGKRHTLKWVLKDINFEISSGETVGILGVNGAGKSTLLKMITGTSRQTTGTIEMNGRVAALLELGMGFHPEFSGRENAYMSGQLLGISKAEMEKLLPEIEAFAEIGDYIDMPVRVYSSGMQVRLAFSVATAIRPDILIVDEALSVGDVYFQNKSLSRIKEYQAKGTTLLFVSHDRGAIQTICDRAILLEEGIVTKDGPPEMVLDYYNAAISGSKANEIEQKLIDNGRVSTISGTREATLERVSLENSLSIETDIIKVGEQVSLKAEVIVNDDIERLVFGYSIRDRLGQVVFGTNTWYTDQVIKCLNYGERVSFEVDFKMDLAPGNYSIQIALSDGASHLEKNFHWVDLALLFSVTEGAENKFIGISWIEPTIKINEL